jgi:hypothetical protein
MYRFARVRKALWTFPFINALVVRKRFPPPRRESITSQQQTARHLPQLLFFLLLFSDNETTLLIRVSSTNATQVVYLISARMGEDGMDDRLSWWGCTS